MIANTIYAAACDGNAALETRRSPRLVLIDGGRDVPARQASPKLTLGQYACAAACSALVVAALCVAALISDALGPQARAQMLSQMPESTLTVRDGDTLWGIAESLGVEGVPTSEVVSWISRRNDVSAAVVAGQDLVVPALASE